MKNDRESWKFLLDLFKDMELKVWCTGKLESAMGCSDSDGKGVNSCSFHEINSLIWICVDMFFSMNVILNTCKDSKFSFNNHSVSVSVLNDFLCDLHVFFEIKM